MKAMQTLVKIPEIQATMRELSKEMMKVSSSSSSVQKHENTTAESNRHCVITSW